jgi:hypothetical protein
MFEQAMGKLRHGEHEHQVEEQFDEGDAMMLVAAAGPQMAGAGCNHSGKAQNEIMSSRVSVT